MCFYFKTTTYITYFENSFSDSIPHTPLHWWSNVLLMQLILQFCDFEILDALLCFFKFKKKINPTFDIQHPKFWITKSAEDLRRTQFKFTKCVVIYVKCISQKKYVFSDGIYSIENAKIFIYTFRPVLLISHNICYVISDVNMSLTCLCLLVKFVLTNKNVFFSSLKNKQTKTPYVSRALK